MQTTGRRQWMCVITKGRGKARHVGALWERAAVHRRGVLETAELFCTMK